MTKYNTGNPVGSSDPRDLYDNAAVADHLVNGGQESHQDRTGTSRKTWKGMEVDFSAAQTQRASQYQAQLDELEQLTESLVGAAIYTDTAAGLAATVEGEHFSVPSPDNSEFLILYRHDAGPFATEINSYPSASWLEQVADRESANEARSQRNSSTLSEHENDLIGLGVTDGDTATQLAAMQASLDEARDLIDTLMGHNQALVDALIHHHSDNADTLSFITADNGQYTPVI